MNASRWISTGKGRARLPDSAHDVLVGCIIHGKWVQWVAHWEQHAPCFAGGKGRWEMRGGGHLNPKDITHWCELPAPPGKAVMWAEDFAGNRSASVPVEPPGGES